MKRIGSLLTAGALALSLVTLPAGAAEAAPALEETAQAAATLCWPPPRPP